MTESCATVSQAELRPLNDPSPTVTGAGGTLLSLVQLLQVEMMQLEVDAMQAEAASARTAAESSRAAVLEVERLGQDNALLAARLSQMDLDLQVACVHQSDVRINHERLFRYTWRCTAFLGLSLATCSPH